MYTNENSFNELEDANFYEHCTTNTPNYSVSELNWLNVGEIYLMLSLQLFVLGQE